MGSGVKKVSAAKNTSTLKDVKTPQSVHRGEWNSCVCSLGDSSMLWRECILATGVGGKGPRMTLDLTVPNNTRLAKEMTGQRILRKFRRQSEKEWGDVPSHGKRGDSIKGDAILPATADLQVSSEIGIRGASGDLNLTRFKRMWGSGEE